MREKLMHFFNIGTTETPEYVLLGDGINSLTEDFNPEQDTKHYINHASGSTKVKSYTPSISVEKEYIQGEKLQEWIDEKVKVLPTGADAESDYVRVNILEKPEAGKYKAVRRRCSYQFDSIGGDAGGDIVNSMTLGGIGEGEQGTFDITTSTFTPATTTTTPTEPGTEGQ